MKHILIITLAWLLITPYKNTAQVIRPHVEQAKPQNQYLIDLRNELQKNDSVKACNCPCIKLCNTGRYEMIRKWRILVMDEYFDIFFMGL